MTSTKIISNKNVRFDVGPETAIADWDHLTLAELNSLTNVSEATKWDGFDLGLQASEQDEDRALTDGDGAATRGYENFGGTSSFFTPTPKDVSSVYRVAKNLLGKMHTEIAAVVRPAIPASAPWAPGQIYNAYHTITDANKRLRGDKNRYWTTDFKQKGRSIVNGIVPSASPKPVAITGPTSATAGGTAQLRATYEGVDITVGAEWASSDNSVAEVSKHGIVIAKRTGSAKITATYPGSAASTEHAITVA